MLALRGARVVLASRSEAKLRATAARIVEGNPNAKVDAIKCDLGDMDSVRACAAAFLKLGIPLHLLVCNAGVMACATRRATRQPVRFCRVQTLRAFHSHGIECSS